MGIELFHAWDSVQSFKVRMCLAELDMPWQSHPIRLTSLEHTKPEYVSINPAGLVPCIRHDGNVITESSIINEYLCEITSNQLLVPGTPSDRAFVRWWCRYEDTVAHMSVRPATFNFHVKPSVSQMPIDLFDTMIASHPNPARAAAYQKALKEPFDEGAVRDGIRDMYMVVKALDSALANQSWLVGGKFTLADIAMAAFLERMEALELGVLMDNSLNMRRWSDEVKLRPSYVKAQGGREHAMKAGGTNATKLALSVLSEIEF